MTALADVTWGIDRVVEALDALADAAGLPTRDAADVAAPPPRIAGDATGLEVWLEQLAAWRGLEIEAVASPYPEVADMLRGAGPALLRIGGASDPRLIALLRGDDRVVTVVTPTRRKRRVAAGEITAAMCAPIEDPVRARCEQVVDRAGLSGRGRHRGLAALLAGRLRFAQVGGCWLLRVPADADVRAHIRRRSLARRLAGLIALHATQYLLWVTAWWAIGRGALDGRVDGGWLLAWALLLVSIIPLRMATTWRAGRLAIDTGALIKRRLMAGALRISPARLRDQGVGQLLGRVLESEAVENLALGGGFAALFAAVELVVAAGVLAMGAGGALHVVGLVAWLALTLWLTRRYLHQRGAWTTGRLDMTHDLVEDMVGHETRLAQQPPDRLHEGEDKTLLGHLDRGRGMDRTLVALTAMVPRGWLIIGVLGLLPAVLAGGVSPAALAVGLGGVLLAFRAFRQGAEGLAQLCGAAISWRAVTPLLAAPADDGDLAPPLTEVDTARGGVAAAEVREVSFAHRGRATPVLDNCSVALPHGARVLLEGPSGSGKSTLGAILGGLRQPDHGLVLAGGLDRPTLGADGWRRRVVTAPQFHENHVFAGTLAFNLLMGRRWPPPATDVAEAEALCRRLGLGEVIDRMPAGMFQMVGETGWQLSHGERSRVFIARALLQLTPLVILDESLAALDPDHQIQVLDVLDDSADSLLLIAHP